MYFVLDCTDHPDRGHIRASTRAQHLEWLARLGDRILSAGPKLDDGGKTPIGSVLIIDFPSRQAAQSFADADPYRQKGLFANVVISRYRQIFPEKKDGI